MVREVKTLWFREKSILDDPLISLPFVGDVSPRRLIVGTICAALAFVATSFSGSSLVQLCSMVVGFVVGATVAKEPKAIDPFKQLLYALTCSYKPVARPRRKAARLKRARVEEVAKLVLEELEPIKIHGIAVDPYSGAPLASAELELYVDGKRVSKTVTDSEGRYAFYARIEPGHHTIEVRLGDIAILRKKVIIAVRKH